MQHAQKNVTFDLLRARGGSKGRGINGSHVDGRIQGHRWLEPEWANGRLRIGDRLKAFKSTHGPRGEDVDEGPGAASYGGLGGADGHLGISETQLSLLDLRILCCWLCCWLCLWHWYWHWCRVSRGSSEDAMAGKQGQQGETSCEPHGKDTWRSKGEEGRRRTCPDNKRGCSLNASNEDLRLVT